MRHVSFTLATLEVDDQPLRLLTGSLMVVRRPDVATLDWEVVATTLPDDTLEQRPVHLVMTELLHGRIFRGDAFVVRSDEQRHVFRGGGQLSGLVPTDDLEDR